MKHFRGVQTDGMTFGMDIDAKGEAYRKLKANTKAKKVAWRYGLEKNVLVCPYQFVAGVMQAAGWLVAERQAFSYITIDDGDMIYVEYPDGVHFRR